MSAINSSPDLVQSAILDVPFLDILGLLKDSSQYLAQSDYDEFGNPALQKEFEAIYSLCPYNNIGLQDLIYFNFQISK